MRPNYGPKYTNPGPDGGILIPPHCYGEMRKFFGKVFGKDLTFPDIACDCWECQPPEEADEPVIVIRETQ